MSKQEDVRRPEKPLEKMREIDNQARIPNKPKKKKNKKKKKKKKKKSIEIRSG